MSTKPCTTYSQESNHEMSNIVLTMQARHHKCAIRSQLRSTYRKVASSAPLQQMCHVRAWNSCHPSLQLMPGEASFWGTGVDGCRGLAHPCIARSAAKGGRPSITSARTQSAHVEALARNSHSRTYCYQFTQCK